ncbi:MAG: hypothetical protein ACOYU5_05315 [Stygiobacter sp.]
MEKLILYIGYAAATIFIGLGIAILFTDYFPAQNFVGGNNMKIIFGIVLILYGIYRNVILTIKHRKNDELPS